MSFTTTITKRYFEMKLVDLKNLGFFEEYKNYTRFWETRYCNLNYSLPCNAVFLVGSKVHRFTLIEKKIINKCEVPEKYYDVISTDKVFVFRCV